MAKHRVYREKMREHLHYITLRHWDRNMRSLGAVALKEILELSGQDDIDDAIAREVRELKGVS